MFLLIKTIRTYIFQFTILSVLTIICIPLALLPEKIRYDNRFYFFLTTYFTKLMVFFAFIFVKIQGEENIPKYPNSPAIFVMNHSSFYDIALIESIINSYPHVWMSKDFYGKVPFFNILLKRMHVLVNRENPRVAIRALFKACDIVKNRASHILLFPEGRRYSDGKVHNFLPGFAILAQKLKRPVIPIAICGMHKIYPKESFLIDSRASDVKLIVGKPFVYDDNQTKEEFMQNVQDWFVSTLAEVES